MVVDANVFAAGMTDNQEYPGMKNPRCFIPLNPSLFESEEIKHAACGYRTSFFLTESDQLYCCGQNSSGELGMGQSTDFEPLSKNKTLIPHYGMIETILGGDTFTFFLMKDGTFWRCGSNNDGQLGAGSTTRLLTPEPLTSPPWGGHKVAKITFGYYHSAVLVNNTVYMSGKLSGSELTSSYTKITDSSEKTIGKIVDIACGVFNTMVVNSKGDLYSIGQSTDYAQTSVWTRMNIDSPVSKIFCGSLSSIAITKQDEVYVWGDNGSGEVGFPSARIPEWTMHHELSYKGIVTIGIHTYQTIMITRSGKFYICGNNSNNQLGLSEVVGLRRNEQLENLYRLFYTKTAFVSGGFQHMIVYFADGVYQNDALNMSSGNLVEEVELSISCSNLPNLDLLSKTDPQVFLFTKGNNNNWVLIGKTEIIWDNLYPKFVTKFLIKYYFETNQYLKFVVVDIDNDSSQNLEDQELVGEMYCTLGEIVGMRGGRLMKPLLLPNKPNVNRGFIAIRYEKVSTNGGAQDIVTFKISASNLDSKNFFFRKSDPFLVISRLDIEASEYSPVYKSEYYKKTLECSWKHFQLTTQTLCNGDKNRGLRFEVLDWEKSGKHELIGFFDTTFEELLQEGKNKTYLLINPELKKKKKNYIGSGNIKIEHIELTKIPSKPTFLDYIRGGHQISLMVAIDFTISNIEAWKEMSLHYMKEGHENDYQRAIRTVGDILNYYDSDKKYPVYGFGGKLPNNKTSYCFAANLNEENPEVYGVDGILEAYKHAIKNVQLSAPTIFSQIIRKAADLSEESKLTNYNILLILTDGVITDMENTIDEIVRATSLPLSIIIVGIGEDSFSNMNILDADEKPLVSSKGVKMVRDIVQFVPFRDFKNADPSRLAKEVLEEVPLQFLSYMASNNIMPNPPVNAESFYGNASNSSNTNQ